MNPSSSYRSRSTVIWCPFEENYHNLNNHAVSSLQGRQFLGLQTTWSDEEHGEEDDEQEIVASGSGASSSVFSDRDPLRNITSHINNRINKKPSSTAALGVRHS